MNYLKLHPKVAAQLKLAGAILVAQVLLVLQGTETLTQALVASAVGVALLVQGYLKSA